MKRKLLAAFVVVACAALNGNSQTSQVGGQNDSANPPGDTLLPRLEKRDELPGPAKGTQDTLQINRPESTNRFSLTNEFGASTNGFGLRTNEFGVVTIEGGLTPTGAAAISNRVYGTNWDRSTNHFGTGTNLTPTGRTNTGTLTPDLQKKDRLSPGLEKQEKDAPYSNP